MARDLGWYLRRLRTMPAAEIVHRTYRTLRHPIDVARMRTGLYAPPPKELADWRGPSTFYFERALTTTPLSPELRERADRLCKGEREVLGLGWLRLADPYWHIEPSRGERWPLIDAARSLGSAPAGFDARLTWELNRGHEWVVLARAWAATRDGRYRERLAAELTSWQQHNPLGVGINWASAMEAAIRIHSLAWVAGYLRGEPLGPIARMIHAHAAFVRRNLSEFSSANNHLIVELSGLIVAARTLYGRPDTDALGRLDQEVSRQFLSDGVNAEMATHYHMFVLEALLLVAHLERRHRAPRMSLEQIIAKMANYVAAIRCDDGSVLGQGDSDDGKLLPLMAEHHADQLIEAARTLARTIPVASKNEGVFWLTGGCSGSIEQCQATSRVFEASRQIVLRSSSFLVSFDAGPFGLLPLAAHAHCDALAVNVAVDGLPFLVDRGTLRYSGNHAVRDQFRMSAAHNTVLIDDDEQAIPAGPFLWSRSPTTVLQQSCIGTEPEIIQAVRTSSRGSQHRRTLLHVNGVLVVIDELSATVREATVYLHFAPEINVTQHANGRVRASLRTASTVLVRTSSMGTVAKTEHSNVYGASCHAATLSFRTRGGVAVTVLSTQERVVPGESNLLDMWAHRVGCSRAAAHLLRESLS